METKDMLLRECVVKPFKKRAKEMNKDMKEAFEASGWREALISENDNLDQSNYEAYSLGFQAAWEIQQKWVESLQEALDTQIECTEQAINNKYNCTEVIATAKYLTARNKEQLTKKEHHEN